MIRGLVRENGLLVMGLVESAAPKIEAGERE